MITPQEKKDIDQALDEIEEAIKRHNQWLALLEASKAALERLEASQPPKGGATDTVCKVLRRVIAQVEEKA